MSNLLRCLEYRYSYAKHTLFETVKATTDCVGRRLMATVSVDDLDSQHLIEHYPAQTTEIPQTSTIALAWVAAALAQPSHAMPAGRSRILRDITACGRTNLLFTDDQKAVAECSNTIRRFQKSKWAVPFHGQATQLSGLCTTIRSLQLLPHIDRQSPTAVPDASPSIRGHQDSAASARRADFCRILLSKQTLPL